MGSRSSGGQQVRVAQGVVRINVAPLEADARQLNTIYKGISESGKQIGTGVQAGTRTAQNSLKELTSSAQTAMGQLARLFALPALVGVTQNVKQINFTLEALAGSEEKANRQLEQMNRLADRTGQSVLSIQKAALGILPAINRANVDLEQTLLLTQRMAILDPFQGTEGAALAIRELLAGQVQSAATRFELPRSELNRIVDAAGGDPQKIIDGLDQLIAKMGITEETITKAGEAGLFTFQRFKDELMQTTAQGFEPMLNNFLIPIVDELGNVLELVRDTNPELLELAGTLAGILATLTAMRAVGLGGTFATGAAAAAGAGFVGVEAGTFIARQAATIGTIDNSKLEGASQDDARKVLEEAFKQVVVLLVDQLINIAFELVEGAITVENAKNAMAVTFEALKTTFEAGNSLFATAFENVAIVIDNAKDRVGAALELMGMDFEEAIRGAITAIGELIAKVPGLGGTGEDIIRSAQGSLTDRTNRALERQRLEGEAGQSLTAGTTPLETAWEEFQDKLQAFEETLANIDIGLTDEQRANLEITKQEIRNKFLIPLAEGLGLLEAKSGSWLDRMREGFSRGAGGTGAADPGEFTDEMLEAFSKFQQGIADLNKKAADDTRKANDAAAEDQTKALNKRNTDLAQLETESTKRRNEIISKSNQAAEDAAEDHQETLAEIQRRGMLDVQRAAARFDAQGVFNALEGMKESERVENQSFDKAKQRREEQTALELSELETANAERLDKIRATFEAERAEIEANRQQRLAQIGAQLRDEIQQRNQAFAELHNRLVAEAREQGNHNARMLNIQQQGLAAQAAHYRDWINSTFGYRPAATTQQVTQAANTVQTAVKNIKIPGFASGIGNVPFDMPAMVHDEELIANAPTANFIRSIVGSNNPSQAMIQQGLARAMGDTYQFSGNVTLSNMGNYTEAAIEELFMNSWRKVNEEMAT